MDDRLIAVFTTADATEALIYRTLLEEDGIPTLLQAQADPWLNNIRTAIAQPMNVLLVRAADAARATQLIADYRQRVEAGEFRLDEDE